MFCKYGDSQHARDDRRDGDRDDGGGGRDRDDEGAQWHQSASPLVCRHDGLGIEASPY